MAIDTLAVLALAACADGGPTGPGTAQLVDVSEGAPARPCAIAPGGEPVTLQAWLETDAAGNATGVHLVLEQVDGSASQWPGVYALPADEDCPAELVDPPWTNVDSIGELAYFEGVWPLPSGDTRLVGLAVRATSPPAAIPCDAAGSCLDSPVAIAAVSATHLVDVP